MAHTDNVVGFWDLDSDSADDSGNGNAGSDTSMSYNGTSAAFSGSSYITLPDNLVTTQGTLALWMNATSGASDYRNAASIGHGPGDANANNQLLQVAYAEPESLVYSTYGQASKSYGSFNQFDHFVVTNDGTTIKIYANGSIGTNGGYLLAPATFFRATIGQGRGGWSNFYGSIRCTAIYSDVKDATWVTDDYNAGTPKKWADWAGGGGTDYVLTADYGSISLAGQSAAFPLTRQLAAANGSIALTGQAAAFPITRRLAADYGSLALSGRNANLVYSGAVAADTNNTKINTGMGI